MYHKFNSDVKLEVLLASEQHLVYNTAKTCKRYTGQGIYFYISCAICLNFMAFSHNSNYTDKSGRSTSPRVSQQPNCKRVTRISG